MERYHLVYATCRLSRFCFCATISESLAHALYPHTQSDMARSLAFEADVRQAFITSGIAQPLEAFHGIDVGLTDKYFCCPLVVPLTPHDSHKFADSARHSICYNMDEMMLSAAGFGSAHDQQDVPFSQVAQRALDQSLIQAKGAVEILHLMDAAGFDPKWSPSEKWAAKSL